MISIILVTHGTFANGIIDSSEMLVGKSGKIEAVTLNLNDDFNQFRQKIQTKAKAMNDGSGVLVLVDLLGGSPYNATAMSLEQKNIECLTGLNLTMLLTALERREYCGLKQLVEECRQAAISGIVSARDFLKELEDTDDESES